MRGFPGFMNQKLGGGAPVALMPMPMLPKAPTLLTPSLPQMPVLARPVITVPTPPPTPIVIVPVVRTVTVATVTRNLQAALGPEAPPPAPTSQGFPGFISRNFNQVSQHQPGASTSNHLSGLANLFNQPTPAAPQRRQARPVPARPAAPVVANPVAPAARPAVATPVAIKKPEPPKASPPQSELPKPVITPQSKVVPPKPAAQSVLQARQPEAPQAPKMAAQELPKQVATLKVKEEEQKKPPVAFVRSGKLGEAKGTAAKTTGIASVQPKTAEAKAPAEVLKVEAKAPAAEAKPAQEAETNKPAAEIKNIDRVEGPAAVTKAPAAAARLTPPANLEKVAQIRPEANEIKIGEVQRQQVNSLQAPVSREQMEMAQQSGAGLSAGGGSGQGGGGSQQRRQQRQQQEGEEGLEEVGGAEALGGDDQVQWWHLRGQDNLRALSSELREAMFLLRTPQRPLGVDPKEVRIQKTCRRQQELVEQPQVQVREQEQPPVSADQVELEATDLCRSCGNDLKGRDSRRCPSCLRQAALATLDLLENDGRFIAYRVFLTVCRQPVASRAVYRLRDFNSLPSGAYCVQAA